MFNICFFDSTRANLKEAGYIFKDKGVNTDISDNLLVIFLQLDQGNISDDGFGSVRREVMRNLNKGYIFGEDTPETYDGGFEYSLKAVEKIKYEMSKEEEFRIWYSDDNYEYCSFCWLLSLFADYDYNKIRVVKLPGKVISRNGRYIRKHCTASFSPEEVMKYIDEQKILSHSEIALYIEEWNRALNENSRLRIVLNGHIVSVNEDFFDSEILKEADKFKGIINEANLVGICASKFSLTDRFVGNRIECMISKGMFEVVSQPAISTPFYCKKIRKLF